MTKVTSMAVVNSTVDNTPIGNTTPSTGQFTTPGSGDNSTNAATTAWAKLGFAVSLGVNGYIKLPTWLGGLVLQWGTSGSTAGGANTETVNVTFPLNPFPTNCFCAVCSADFLSPGSHGGTVTMVTAKSTAGLTITFTNADSNNHVGVGQAYWLAIGN